VADGILCHGFSTERYLREATIPALERGRHKAGHSGIKGFEISAPSFVVARDTEEDIAQGAQLVKQQIAFYGSTPAYRPVLDLHGWGDLQDELNAMTKRGAWGEMANLIDDEILHTFAIIGTPEDAVDEILKRYGDVATRITLPIPDGADPTRWAPLFEKLRAA
jgi:probable F420-dependent oxidoreductase